MHLETAAMLHELSVFGKSRCYHMASCQVPLKPWLCSRPRGAVLKALVQVAVAQAAAMLHELLIFGKSRC